MKPSNNPFLVLSVLVLFTYPATAQWVRTNGPWSTISCRQCHNVTALAVRGSNIFAGTNGGIFLSLDNGTSWAAVDSGLTNDSVLSLAANSTAVFAGTHGGGIFRSVNNGAKWIAADSGLTNTRILSLAVSGSAVFAGTHGGGVFRSDNNGTGWSTVNSGLTNDSVRSLAVSGGSVFAGTHGGGVFRSDNNGTSWTAVDSGLTNTNVLSLAVSGGAVFAGTHGGGVFRSVNNGAGWTVVNSGLTNDTVLCLAANGSAVFAGTSGDGVFLSVNNGAGWTAVNSGLTDTNVRALAVCGSTLFAGTYSGVWSRPLSEITGVSNRNTQKGMLKTHSSGFKINISKNGIAVSLPETLNNGAITVGLFTIAGKRIYSATHQTCNGSLNIPVSGLSTGAYLMSITGRNIAQSLSFVVTK